jgi:hypothetical protein
MTGRAAGLGQAAGRDIVRELIDGATGLLQDHDTLSIGDRTLWSDFRERVDAAARLAAGS